jgi:hypothetical protein
MSIIMIYTRKCHLRDIAVFVHMLCSTFDFMLARVCVQGGMAALDYATQQGKHDVARLIEVRFAISHVLNSNRVR